VRSGKTMPLLPLIVVVIVVPLVSGR
jgi:hypothetical protein